jgi:hypothetical protein
MKRHPPPIIEGPSGAKILEKRPIGVGQFFRKKIAIRETIIEGPGPFIAGGGDLLYETLKTSIKYPRNCSEGFAVLYETKKRVSNSFQFSKPFLDLV